MKTKTTNVLILLLTTVFILACSLASVQAQTATPQPQAQDTTQAQTTQAPNLQLELGLTPDQIQKWRAMNQELRPQEVAGTVKVRQAKLALAEAMEAQSPNEDVIKQRAKELADAQSVMTQLQALRQARMLQILTPDQRIKLKEIRERNQALRRGNQQQSGNGLNQRQQLKRQNAPLLTPAERRALRRQQKLPGRD
jgi:Spy/CpxP family protein refolding chaperone